MNNKIVEFRGIENLVVAEVVKDEASEIQFGEVKSLAGIANLSKEVESNSETHYYDNMPAIVINTLGPDTITISTSVLALAMRAFITGARYDESKGMLIEGSEQTKYFAIGYKTKATDGTYRYVWRLKGTFAIPSSEHATENNENNANGQELVFTGIKTVHKFTNNTDANGNPDGAKGIVIDGAKTNDTSFFASVLTPDTFTPVTPTTNVTITYDGNGKTSGDVPASQTVASGSPVTLSSGAGLEKSGDAISGWNTQSDGSGTKYNLGATITPTTDMTLYADFTTG